MDNGTTYNLKAKGDHILSFIRKNPIDGLCELIWNAFDADANNILIKICMDIGNEEINVCDDGIGFTHKDTKIKFVDVGNSSKKNKRITASGRFVHGSEGRGRLSAFGVARVVHWKIRYLEAARVMQFDINGIKEKCSKIQVLEPNEVSNQKSGVSVTLHEINDRFTEFKSDNAIQKIANGILARVASYLACYRNINVEIGSLRLNYEDAIYRSKFIPLEDIHRGGKKHKHIVEILEWNSVKVNEIFLSQINGDPLVNVSDICKKFKGFNYTIFIRSDYFNKSNVESLLLSEFEHDDSKIIKSSIKAIEEYFHNRISENGGNQLKKWKENNAYPYTDAVSSPVEEVERKSFDIISVELSKYSTAFNKSSIKDQKLFLALIKAASFSSLDDLTFLLNQISGLTEKKRKFFMLLIRKIPLSIIIDFNFFVIRRIKILKQLEKLLFDDELNISESSIHKLLEKNLWIFGDKYLLLSSDENLDGALKKLSSKGILPKTDRTEPVLDVDGVKRRPDLFLQGYLRIGDEFCPEFLVVELKAPKHAISKKDIEQVKNYANTFISDGRFKQSSKKTIWNFWLVTNNIDKKVKFDLEANNLTNYGFIRQITSDNTEHIIRIMHWKEILDINNDKLKVYARQLEAKLKNDDGYQFVLEKHASMEEALNIFEID